MTPKSAPESNDTPKANASTNGSMPISFSRGNVLGPLATRIRKPRIRQPETQRAAKHSQRHAFDEHLPARSAPSRRQARRGSRVPAGGPRRRTSNRLATFAQAISSTSPSVPITTQSAVPTSPTMSCFSGWICGPKRALRKTARSNPGGGGQAATRLPACEPDPRWPAPS